MVTFSPLILFQFFFFWLKVIVQSRKFRLHSWRNSHSSAMLNQGDIRFKTCQELNVNKPSSQQHCKEMAYKRVRENFLFTDHEISKNSAVSKKSIHFEAEKFDQSFNSYLSVKPHSDPQTFQDHGHACVVVKPFSDGDSFSNFPYATLFICCSF